MTAGSPGDTSMTADSTASTTSIRNGLRVVLLIRLPLDCSRGVTDLAATYSSNELVGSSRRSPAPRAV